MKGFLFGLLSGLCIARAWLTLEERPAHCNESIAEDEALLQRQRDEGDAWFI